MKKNISKVLFVLLSIFTLFSFVACNNSFTKIENDDNDVSILSIKLPGSNERSISIDDVHHYEVVLSKLDGTLYDKRIASSGEVIEYREIPVFEYKLKISAFNAASQKIAEGEDSVVPIPPNYKKYKNLIDKLNIDVDIPWDKISEEVTIVLHEVQ